MACCGSSGKVHNIADIVKNAKGGDGASHTYGMKFSRRVFPKVYGGPSSNYSGRQGTADHALAKYAARGRSSGGRFTYAKNIASYN